MTRQHAAAIVLVVFAVAGILTAAALAGHSEARPFAVPGSLECPPFDVGQPISDEERKYGAEYHRRAAKQLIETRTSVAAARRAEIMASVVLPSFRRAVSGADRVVTGTVVDQRIGYVTGQADEDHALFSMLRDDGVRVFQNIAARCQQGESVALAYIPGTPPLEPGRRYALVVGVQQQHGAREVLLAYELDGIKISQFWPTSDSPIGSGSTLDHLIDAVNNSNN